MILNLEKYPDMRKQYEKLLFRKDKPSTFKDRNAKMFTGYYTWNLRTGGNLVVEFEDSILKEYAFKELELLH